jgi:hypothetical protein
MQESFCSIGSGMQLCCVDFNYLSIPKCQIVSWGLRVWTGIRIYLHFTDHLFDTNQLCMPHKPNTNTNTNINIA